MKVFVALVSFALTLVLGYAVFLGLVRTAVRGWKRIVAGLRVIGTIDKGKLSRAYSAVKREAPVVWRTIRKELWEQALKAPMLVTLVSIIVSIGWVGEWVSPHLSPGSRVIEPYMWAVGIAAFLVALYMVSFLRHVSWIESSYLVFALLFFGVIFLFAAMFWAWRGTLKFQYTVAFTVSLLILLVLCVKVFIDDESTTRPGKLLIALVGYVVAYGYLLLSLGIYNGGHDLIRSAETVSGYFKTALLRGTDFLSGVPSTGGDRGLEPFFEYQLGFLFNTVTVGFFVSYFASLFLSAEPSPRTGQEPPQHSSNESGERLPTHLL